MKVLITGGAGFIGSNMASALTSRGHTVRVMDNLSPQIHGEDPRNSQLFLSLGKNVEFIFGDVRNRNDWERSLEGQDAVLHLAAETGTGQSMYDIEKYVDVNVRGTALLLDYLVNKKHTITKVIVASSRAIYGEGKYECGEHGIVYPEARSGENMQKGDFEVKCPNCGKNARLLPTDEMSLVHPSSMYGITKHDQERMVLSTCKSVGIKSAAFRYQNVYGPGQSLKNPYTGILSIFSTRILNGNPIQVFEDGTESRDFVFIDDVVAATVKGIESQNLDGEAFNVGADKMVSVVEVVENLRKNFDKPDFPYEINGKFRLGDIRHNLADLSRVRNKLGYEPTVNFEKGIKAFCEWVKKQEVEEDRFDHSIEEMKKKGLYK